MAEVEGDEDEVVTVKVEAAVAEEEERLTGSLTMDILRNDSQTKSTAAPTDGMFVRDTSAQRTPIQRRTITPLQQLMIPKDGVIYTKDFPTKHEGVWRHNL